MDRIIQLTFSLTPNMIPEDNHVIGFFAEDKLEEAKQAALEYLQKEIQEPEYWSSDEGDVGPSQETIDQRTREYVVSLDWRPLNAINHVIREEDEIAKIGVPYIVES